MISLSQGASPSGDQHRSTWPATIWSLEICTDQYVDQMTALILKSPPFCASAPQ